MSASSPIRILHVDGDSFFASCEIARDDKLQGRPVWVGGGRRGLKPVMVTTAIASILWGLLEIVREEE